MQAVVSVEPTANKWNGWIEAIDSDSESEFKNETYVSAAENRGYAENRDRDARHRQSRQWSWAVPGSTSLHHAPRSGYANTARTGLRFCGSSLAMVYSLLACRAARGEGAFGAAQAAGASGRPFLVDFRA